LVMESVVVAVDIEAPAFRSQHRSDVVCLV
jgi:hypothetical protein